MQNRREGIQDFRFSKEAAGTVETVSHLRLKILTSFIRLIFYDAHGQSGIAAKAFDHGKFLVAWLTSTNHLIPF